MFFIIIFFISISISKWARLQVVNCCVTQYFYAIKLLNYFWQRSQK